MSSRLKEELRIVESEMDVLVCEPKCVPFLRENVSEDDEEGLAESHGFCRKYRSNYGGDECE